MSPISFNILGQRLNRGTYTLLFAVFRQSFAVAAFTDNDRTQLLCCLAAYDKIGGNLRVFAPGEVQDPA